MNIKKKRIAKQTSTVNDRYVESNKNWIDDHINKEACFEMRKTYQKQML